MIGSQIKKISQKEVVSDLAKALKDLIDIIELENTALKEGRITSASGVVEKKVNAAAKFAEADRQVELYAKSGGAFDKDSSALKKVRELLAKFEDIKQENEILIKSGIEINENLMEMYKARKLKENARQYGYNKDGNLASDKIKKFATSVGYNDKV